MYSLTFIFWSLLIFNHQACITTWTNTGTLNNEMWQYENCITCPVINKCNFSQLVKTCEKDPHLEEDGISFPIIVQIWCQTFLPKCMLYGKLVIECTSTNSSLKRITCTSEFRFFPELCANASAEGAASLRPYEKRATKDLVLVPVPTELMPRPEGEAGAEAAAPVWAVARAEARAKAPAKAQAEVEAKTGEGARAEPEASRKAPVETTAWDEPREPLRTKNFLEYLFDKVLLLVYLLVVAVLLMKILRNVLCAPCMARGLPATARTPRAPCFPRCRSQLRRLLRWLVSLLQSVVSLSVGAPASRPLILEGPLRALWERCTRGTSGITPITLAREQRPLPYEPRYAPVEHRVYAQEGDPCPYEPPAQLVMPLQDEEMSRAAERPGFVVNPPNVCLGPLGAVYRSREYAEVGRLVGQHSRSLRPSLMTTADRVAEQGRFEEEQYWSCPPPVSIDPQRMRLVRTYLGDLQETYTILQAEDDEPAEGDGRREPSLVTIARRRLACAQRNLRRKLWNEIVHVVERGEQQRERERLRQSWWNFDNEDY